MRKLNKRLDGLEKRACIVASDGPRMIVRIIVSPDDVKNGRPGRLGAISILGTKGRVDGMRFFRGEDEGERAFLERAGEGYRAVHGRLPGNDWYDRDAA